MMKCDTTLQAASLDCTKYDSLLLLFLALPFTIKLNCLWNQL